MFCCFGKRDTAFVTKTSEENTRLDSRKNNKERITIYSPLQIAQTDGSVRVTRGSSTLQLSIQFKEIAETLLSAGIQCNKVCIFPKIESPDFPIPEIIQYPLEKSLSTLKVGIRISLNIINDDGNIHDMFFLALAFLLNSIDVPIIEKNIRMVQRQSIPIPQATTFAVIGHSLVRDPTKIEEHSSSGLIHIFTQNNNFLTCISTRILRLHHSTLQNILSQTLISE